MRCPPGYDQTTNTLAGVALLPAALKDLPVAWVSGAADPREVLDNRNGRHLLSPGGDDGFTLGPISSRGHITADRTTELGPGSCHSPVVTSVANAAGLESLPGHQPSRSGSERALPVLRRQGLGRRADGHLGGRLGRAGQRGPTCNGVPTRTTAGAAPGAVVLRYRPRC
jgi:hypothetical protein